ncbi:MAG: antitoxin VapB family protein [Candidatus Micrarchaeia archaeon]
MSVSDEVYLRLASLKRVGESFNALLLRLATKKTKPSVKEFFGKWKMSEREAAAMERELKKLWGRWSGSLRH